MSKIDLLLATGWGICPTLAALLGTGFNYNVVLGIISGFSLGGFVCLAVVYHLENKNRVNQK